jgi:4-hydroxythreonine-4-phosphate dehydrogenase
VVVGSAARLRQVVEKLGLRQQVDRLQRLEGCAWERSAQDPIPCWEPEGAPDVAEVPLGQIDARAGKAAHDYLVAGIQACKAQAADGLVTAPLHKGALHAAGLPYPGHTEILAEHTGTRRFAMMLYGQGIGVSHVTLHVALRDVFARLTVAAVQEKVELTAQIMARILNQPARIGVFGLNPHAGDGGLFGDEEARVIVPAVAAARAAGIDVTGPWPSDTLFGRAARGEFNGLVAMYHDQGHIGMKLLAGYRAVNISVGLPILRTSVAHGTAFDLAPHFRADPTSLLEAVKVAARLAATCPGPAATLP